MQILQTAAEKALPKICQNQFVNMAENVIDLSELTLQYTMNKEDWIV